MDKLRNLFIIKSFIDLFFVLAFVYLNLNTHILDNLYSDFIEKSQTMGMVADQLRHSSDDLTRFARTYAATGDKKYLKIFHKILAIRNGKAPRPTTYNFVYWDYLEPSKIHQDGPPLALSQIINSLPYTKQEKAKIQESHRNSDKLVALEQKAFHAIEGRFQDASGKYTISKKPNKDLAIKLLYSNEYHLAKQSIMRPLDEFLQMLAKRSKLEEKKYARIQS